MSLCKFFIRSFAVIGFSGTVDDDEPGGSVARPHDVRHSFQSFISLNFRLTHQEQYFDQVSSPPPLARCGVLEVERTAHAW